MALRSSILLVIALLFNNSIQQYATAYSASSGGNFGGEAGSGVGSSAGAGGDMGMGASAGMGFNAGASGQVGGGAGAGESASGGGQTASGYQGK